MDTTSIIEIILAIFVVFIFIKFIVSPVIKIILGIIIFLFLIYVLQRFFGLDIDQALAHFGVSLGLNGWITSLNWVFGPANYYIDLIKNFLSMAWQSFPKSLNQQ